MHDEGRREGTKTLCEVYGKNVINKKSHCFII